MLFQRASAALARRQPTWLASNLPRLGSSRSGTAPFASLQTGLQTDRYGSAGRYRMDLNSHISELLRRRTATGRPHAPFVQHLLGIR
jgi:hypothetical protein